MYSVYGTYMESGRKNNVCIYSDKYVSPDMKAINPKLTLTDNSAGSLDITLTVGNAGYDKLKRMRSEITVYKDDKEIWSGRILSEKKDFQNNRILTCEGELAYLNDTIQPPAEYSSGSQTLTDDEENKVGITLYDFLNKVLAEHNKYVDDEKKFYVDLNKELIWKQNETLPVICTNYETTLECINTNVIERFGGHILIEKKDGKRYLKYIEKGLNQNSQIIRFGESLLDFTKNWDLSNLSTVIIPRGAKLEESDISENLEAYTTVSEIEFTDADTKERVIKFKKNEDGVFILSILEDIYSETESRVTLLPVNNIITLKYTDENGNVVKVVPTVYGYNENDEELARESELFTEVDAGGYIILRLDKNNNVILAKDEKGVPTITWNGMYVISKQSANEYGHIEKVADFSDETDGIMLLEKAKKYLEESQFDEMALQVSAVDLSYLSEKAEPLSILDTVQCVSKPHGMNYASFSVTQLSIQLDRPDSAKYTLESTVKSSVGSTSLSSSTNSANSDIIHKIENLPTKQSILQRAKKQADKLITEATNGYITIVLEEEKAGQGKHSEALVISSGQDYRESEHYWVWNINGLGHYTNGVADNPNIAITMDGQIVANYITTGTMSADRVRTGFLVSQDNNVVWNLNNTPLKYPYNSDDENVPTYPAGSLTIKKGSISLGATDSYPKGNFSVDDEGNLHSVSGDIGGFTIKEDGIYNAALELNSAGLHFIDDNRNVIGSFAPNYWLKNDAEWGVVTNLSTEGKFMSWGVQKSPDSPEYEYKLFYVAKNRTLLKNNGGYFEGDTLYFGCPVDFNNHEIRNFNHAFDKDDPLILDPNNNCKVNYGYTGKVILPTFISQSDGTVKMGVEVLIKNGFVCGINALNS